jgi:serine/threonine-protein kinase
MSAVELQPERVIAGRYRLTRHLARGGMGFVWVARHLQLDIDVAIKFMAPASLASPEARARFEREAKASARLQSPNIVQIYDYGIEDDLPFLVMELLRGEDLEARLRRDGRLSLAETRAIVAPVCAALLRAHDAGLIHRDLKPANLFVGPASEGSVVKVLDFGIAKDTHLGLVDAATQTGAIVGSPHYMSPEQVRRSRDVDPRSDLWSLGVIIFRCLTGQLPFPGDEVGDVLIEVCADPIPIPSAIEPSLGPEVDRFLARALSRDLEQRFQSAGELLAAFVALADGATAVVATAAGSPAAHSIGTFAPASSSHLEAPRARSRRLGVGLLAASGALAIGLVALVVARLSPPPPALPAASAPDASSAAIVASASPPPVAAFPSSEPAEIAPSATPSASASSSPSVRRPPNSAPPRNRGRTKNDDLLKEM